MERLLPELALKVATFLSPRDLSACCAVSVHWRDVFGTNEVWKPLCDEEVEEYLRTTPCLVEPAFSVPHDQDSTLTPLSQWRLAFMREQHLDSNLRKENCKTVEIKMAKVPYPWVPFRNYRSRKRFITNDFFVNFKPYSIELWDVRSLNPVLVDSLDFEYNIVSEAVFENGLVVLQMIDGCVQVVKVDVVEGNILLKCQFRFNETSRMPELVLDSVYEQDTWGSIRYLESIIILITKRGFCIGYCEGQNYFHVWDLETGVKLREESCQTDVSVHNAQCGVVVVSGTCDDILVLVPYDIDSQSSKIGIKCQIYDVLKLRFFSFRKTCRLNHQLLGFGSGRFAIINSFVALTDQVDITIKTVRIFNYRTDEQLYLLDVISLGIVQIQGDTVGFIVKDIFPIEGGVDVRPKYYFEARGNRLIKVSQPDFKFWRIHKSKFSRGKPVPNRACTKVLRYKRVKTDKECGVLKIMYFW